MQALLIHKCAPFHYFTSQAFLNSHLFITSHFYTIVSILYQFENIFNLHNIAYFLCPRAFKEIVWTFYQNNILMQAIFMYVCGHTSYLLLAFSSASPVSSSLSCHIFNMLLSCHVNLNLSNPAHVNHVNMI